MPANPRRRDVWKLYWIGLDGDWHDSDPEHEVGDLEEAWEVVDED